MESSDKQSTAELDKVDIEIMKILVADAKVPYTEIARRLLVSPGTIHVRMKKLEDAGVVKGARLLIDPFVLGYDLTAFLGIFLDKGSVYRDVVADLEQIDEVVEAHYTTGNYGIFLKVMCRNTRHLRDVLNDKIQAIKGVQRTETILSLEESIHRTVSLDNLLG